MGLPQAPSASPRMAAAEHMSNTAIDNLPNEVLTEVMFRVPTSAALVHAAAVSKRWRGVIATPAERFLDEYRARHRSSPLLGLYIPRESGGLPAFQKADSIQSANGDDDLQRAAAKAFSLRGLESNPEWRLLDCYNGRLLLARGQESLQVYNPLSCERISVPLPQDDMLLDYFSTCLLQGRCNNDASSFRVVSLQHHRHGRGQMVDAVEYDSQRQSWNHHRDWDTLKNVEGNEQGEVMHAGNLIFCEYNGTSLLLLDTSKMHFSVLPLPCHINPKNYAIGEMEDGVCCLAAVDSVGKLNTLHLSVWKLVKLEWKLEKEMQLKQVLGENAVRGHLYYRVHKVTNGLALLGWSNGNQHFIIDLKTFTVMEKFEFSKHICAFPMQMPWPPAISVATISGEQSTPSTGAQKHMSANLTAHDASVVTEVQNHVCTIINSGSTEGKNPGTAAGGGEAEGAETGAKSEVEAVETSVENENMAEDSHTKGDAVEESPPPSPPRGRHHRQKLGECGDPPPDHLRCIRNDGKKWRCSSHALPTVRFCEYHYAKANKGMKLPADGEVLSVALQRLKNKRKGKKNINPPASPWPPTFSVAAVDGGGNQPELKLGDGAASQNCMPSRTPENLGIQDPVESVSTLAGEECFRKEINVPDDYDLQALIPDLCDQVSDLMHPEGTRPHHLERRESMVRLELCVRCPIAVRNDLHPKYCIMDSEVNSSNVVQLNQSPPPSRCSKRARATTLDPIPKDDEAEEAPVPSSRRRRRQQKSGERDDTLLPPPDHLRCARSDGKKWRCSAKALPTVRFCKYHYRKANKGKKLPVDGKVLAVVLERQKNKRKGRKSINPPVSPQATTSDHQNRDILNGPMTAEGDAVESPPPSPPHGRRRLQKLGERGDPLPPLPDHLRCARNDGKKWRCSGLALPTVSFCEYHYAKANKGKKLPADGEVLAVALQRLKNKWKDRKSIDSPASPQATTSACQTRFLLNGLMTIPPGSSGPAALSSPVTTKVVPRAMSMTKAVPTTKNMSPLRFDEGSRRCQLQKI